MRMIRASAGRQSARPSAPLDAGPPEPQPEVSPYAQLVVAASGVLIGVAALAWATTSGAGVVRFNDFYREAWPAYGALRQGHVLGFVQLGPTYVGSLILRAPFAMIPVLWGGGRRAIYFASALPCMLALACFCVWLGAQPRRRGRVRAASQLSPLFWCICNPITIVALFGGHPEEILGAVLSVGAVILAVKKKPGWAGLLLGLAVINKSWALVAVPVVFVVLVGSHWRALLTFAGTVGIVLLPVAIARAQTGGSSGGLGGSLAASQTGTIFNASQLLWWFGPHAWISQNARGGIVLFAVLACLLFWWARRGRAQPLADDLPTALLLLAFVFLARAALDPWNNLYYHLPFLFSLIAYEASSGRMPRLTILYTILFLFTVPVSGVAHMSPDVRAAAYMIVVLPTFAWMAARIYLPPGALRRSVRRPGTPAGVASATRVT